MFCGTFWSGRDLPGVRRMAAERSAMSNATAAGVFVAVSLIAIASAVLIVRGYFRRR